MYLWNPDLMFPPSSNFFILFVIYDTMPEDGNDFPCNCNDRLCKSNNTHFPGKERGKACWLGSYCRLSDFDEDPTSNSRPSFGDRSHAEVIFRLFDCQDKPTQLASLSPDAKSLKVPISAISVTAARYSIPGTEVRIRMVRWWFLTHWLTICIMTAIWSSKFLMRARQQCSRTIARWNCSFQHSTDLLRSFSGFGWKVSQEALQPSRRYRYHSRWCSRSFRRYPWRSMRA